MINQLLKGLSKLTATSQEVLDEGLIAKTSPSFPHRSINLGYRAVVLPKDGSVPGMPDWKCLHSALKRLLYPIKDILWKEKIR
jgi:hypothetical protein